MPRVLKSYGECERCHQMVRGSKNKSSHRNRVFHKTCPSSEPTECAICMENTANIVRTSCGHSFHMACLGKWHASGQPNSHTCPYCRAQLVQPTILITQEQIEFTVAILMTLPLEMHASLNEHGIDVLTLFQVLF